MDLSFLFPSRQLLVMLPGAGGSEILRRADYSGKICLQPSRLYDFRALGDKRSGWRRSGRIATARGLRRRAFFCIHSDTQLFPALLPQSACSTCSYLTISCLLFSETLWCSCYANLSLDQSIRSFSDKPSLRTLSL